MRIQFHKVPPNIPSVLGTLLLVTVFLRLQVLPSVLEWASRKCDSASYNAMLHSRQFRGVRLMDQPSPFMDVPSNPLIFGVVASATFSTSTSELRWEFTVIAIGVVLLTFGLTGTVLFFLRPKIGDRSLVFFSLFAILYAIRLIFRQNLFQSLVPAPGKFWNYSDLVIDNFIAVPLTLFLIEIVQRRWKTALRWLLAFQIVFATARFFSQFFKAGQRPIEMAYHIVIAGYCVLLFLYPFLSARPGQSFARELKVVYSGLVVFAIFVIHTDLVDMGLIHGRSVEPIGFLVLVGCLGYVAASRTYANEQRLLSIQSELEIARQIQYSILPREVPHLSGLEIAARCMSMAEVAGDFYDFIVVDERAGWHSGGRCHGPWSTRRSDRCHAEECAGCAVGPRCRSRESAQRFES